MHTLRPSTTKVLRQIQKLGGQAITGAFNSAAEAIVEAEAYISPLKARQGEKALKTLIDLHTLPSHHPISRLSLRSCKKFVSPLQRIRKELSGFHPRRLEKIKPYVIAPWEPRIVYEKYTQNGDGDASTSLFQERRLLITTTAVENRHGIAYGFSQAYVTTWTARGVRINSSRIQNSYTAELQAVVEALKRAKENSPPNSTVLMVSANLSVLQVLNKPDKQSGQCLIQAIYNTLKELKQRSVKVIWMWISATIPCVTRDRAKEGAHKALEGGGSTCTALRWDTMSSTISQMAPQLAYKKMLPQGVGNAIRELDTALPGKHIKEIYNFIIKRDARILIQLRTGCARLNQYLSRIKVVNSPSCQCDAAPESVRHFLFSCSRWIAERKELYKKWPDKEGNMRFFLGAKSTSDTNKWKPEREAITAVINYARATMRLDIEEGAER